MLEGFKSEIRTLLIVAIVAVGVSVGSILLLRNTIPASVERDTIQICAETELSGYEAKEEVLLDLDGDGEKELIFVYEENNLGGCSSLLPAIVKVFSGEAFCPSEVLRYPGDSSKIQGAFKDSRDNSMDIQVFPNFWGDRRNVVMVTGSLNFCGSGTRTQMHFFAHDGKDYIRVVGPTFNEISTYRFSASEPRGKEILVAKGIWDSDEGHFSPHRFQLIKYEWTGEEYKKIELGTTKNKYPLQETGSIDIDEMIGLEADILEPATEDWQTYRNEEYGFEVKYPEQWEFSEQEDRVSFKDSETEYGFEGSPLDYLVWISVQDIPQRYETIESYAQSRYRPDYKDRMSNITLDGVQAIKLSDYLRTETILFHHDKLYTFYRVNAGYPEISTAYDQMLSTFRFVDREQEIPTDKTSCEAKGGTWARFGLLGVWKCNLPTSDAGKACTDSNQCENACIAEPPLPVDQPVVGQCYGWTELLGTCLTYVKNGKVDAELCID